MPQIKKTEIRDAILKAAFDLFAKQGYTKTTLPQIAKGAKTSTANVYVYFGSKLEILYAIYDPWIRKRFQRLDKELQAIPEPLERLRKLLQTYWRDIPAENKGFANNIIQAISTSSPEDRYRPDLLEWMEGELRRLVLDCLPPSRRHIVLESGMSHLLVMAFDGFILYHHLDRRRPCDDQTIDLLCRMLLGKSTRKED